MSCHSLLAWRVSIDRSAVILMRIPLCVICCFSLADFNICSLCLIFVNLITMCLGVFRLGFFLFVTLWVSWTWVAMSFPILGKFSAIISSSNFSWPFFLSSSSGTPMIRMLGCFTLSQRSAQGYLMHIHSYNGSDSILPTVLSWWNNRLRSLVMGMLGGGCLGSQKVLEAMSYKEQLGTSLVVQWLRLCRGHGFHLWSGN